MSKLDYFKHDMRAHHSVDESAEIYTVTWIETGDTEVVVKKTITKRFPVQKIKEAEDLFERLICGGGRRAYTLDDLAHPFNPKS